VLESSAGERREADARDGEQRGVRGLSAPACRGRSTPRLGFLRGHDGTLAPWVTKAHRIAPVYDSVEHTNSFTLLALNIKARFAELTDWLGPDPARCFDCPVDPAPAEQ